MRPARFLLLPGALFAALVCAGSPQPFAQEPGTDAGSDWPNISASKIEQVSQDELLLTGDVDLRYGGIRLLADWIRYNDATRMAHAEGNVVLMYGESQISGDRLELNVDTRLATIWNAHGYMDPDVIFEAEKLERIADDKVVITSGTVTTCTQPTPYWAFHVTKATLHVDNYAYMHNVALKLSKAPVFYVPYLIWPMKSERASGLLLPNVGYSRRRGSFLGNAFYLVMGRSQDATFYYDRYGESGTGLGLEYRFVPAQGGRGTFTGYYLRDEVQDPTQPGDDTRERYRLRFFQTQKFAGGFRLLADLNTVSDLDYYLDFERDITQTTSPTVFSQIDLSRNWSNYFMNVRLDRQEQFLTTTQEVILQRLPEMEVRGRGIRFGDSPFYLSFESSAGLYEKARRVEIAGTSSDPNVIADPATRRLDTVYQRYDLFPTISASFTPTPGLDISPSLSARETIWTSSVGDAADPNSFTLDDPESRAFASFNLSIVGPRYFRIFGDPRGDEKSSYKNTFEPRIVYSFIPEVRGGENIIRFDDVDVLGGDVHSVTYSLTSRLFAKRPAREEGPEPPEPEEPPAEDLSGPTQVQGPVSDLKDLPEGVKEALKDTERQPGIGSVEVATFELAQTYSFDQERPLSQAVTVEPDGTLGDVLEAQADDITASMRYNPTAAASLDLRAAYDILFDDIKTVSLSASLRSLQRGYVNFSYFLNRDLRGFQFDPDQDPNTPELARRFLDQSQLRLIGGTSFLQRKITLDLEGSYDIENSDLQNQRYRLGYNTQCCGVLVEYARRDFETIDEIEYRFTLNLRGVGTFLDLQAGPR